MKIVNLIYVCTFLILMTSSCSNQEKKKLSKDVSQLSDEKLKMGAQIYRSKCMNCHLKNGQGVKHFYPPLAGSDFLEHRTEEAIYMVKFGSNKPIKVKGVKYHSLMPTSGLTDKELVLVFNYILNSWGNDLGTVSLKQIEEVRRK